MKICWDNLERLRYSKKTGKLYKGSDTYIFKEGCLNCNNDFLMLNRNYIDGLYCSVSCKNKHIPPNNSGENNPMYGRKHTTKSIILIKENRKGKCIGKDNPAKRPEVRKKISKACKMSTFPRNGINNGMYGRKHSEESRKKISDALKEVYKLNWKRQYRSKGLPIYDTHASQIKWCEKVRRDPDDKSVLQVKCIYCGRWMIPTISGVNNRMQILKGSEFLRGEHRFYCSDRCKSSCPIYGKSPEQLMKADAVRAGRDPWWEMVREVQPELRQMVFERDDWTCVKCGSNEQLHCHHMEGIRWEPLESADMDRCMTVCKDCHNEIHQQPDCGYHDMKCKEQLK